MDTPWSQLRKLYPLLLDMTPCDVAAFVPAAEQTGFNPVALLIMALAKHPTFIERISDLSRMHGLTDPDAMGEAIRWALDGLGRDESDRNCVWHVCIEPLTITLLSLGILLPDDAKAGIRLAAGRFTVVPGVPSNLQGCFDAARSHQFPFVTKSSDIPRYLISWGEFLAKLPAAMDVGDDSNGKEAMSIIGKVKIWLTYRFPDALPTPAGDATLLWPDSPGLNTATRCVVISLDQSFR